MSVYVLLPCDWYSSHENKKKKKFKWIEKSVIYAMNGFDVGVCLSLLFAFSAFVVFVLVI